MYTCSLLLVRIKCVDHKGKNIKKRKEKKEKKNKKKDLNPSFSIVKYSYFISLRQRETVVSCTPIVGGINMYLYLQ